MNRKASCRFEAIAHKMMCGLARSVYTPAQFESFKKKYKTVITWVDDTLPGQFSGRSVSVGVLGAIGKGILWYGQAKMEPFCNALANGHFKGIGDPAHVLWLWLSGRAKYTSNLAYKKTIAAIRAYIGGKQLVRIPRNHASNSMYKEVRSITAAEADLFEWSDDFTTMSQCHNGRRISRPTDVSL